MRCTLASLLPAWSRVPLRLHTGGRIISDIDVLSDDCGTKLVREYW